MNYLFLDNGFEEIEALTTVDLLRRAGVELTTVAIRGEIQVTGAHQIIVHADRLFDDCDFADAEMLILPGGAAHLENHEALCNLLKKHNADDHRVAASCYAPSVPRRLGILDRTQATHYPGFRSYLGVSYIGGLFLESKNVITAKGPGLSSDFAFCIIEKLKGSEVADAVYDAAQY